MCGKLTLAKKGDVRWREMCGKLRLAKKGVTTSLIVAAGWIASNTVCCIPTAT